MRSIEECEGNSGWREVTIPSASDLTLEYLVLIPPWALTEPSEIICECPSYDFRGHCRHMAEALAMMCHWSELEGKEQETPGICPECQNPTRKVMVADEVSYV